MPKLGATVHGAQLGATVQGRPTWGNYPWSLIILGLNHGQISFPKASESLSEPNVTTTISNAGSLHIDATSVRPCSSRPRTCRGAMWRPTLQENFRILPYWPTLKVFFSFLLGTSHPFSWNAIYISPNWLTFANVMLDAINEDDNNNYN